MSSLFDYISPEPWTVKDNDQLGLFELLDGNGNRIAMFKKKTDAHIASGAISTLSRLMYLKDFQRSVLGQIDECLRLCFADMHIEMSGTANDPATEFEYDESHNEHEDNLQEVQDNEEE